MAAALPIRKANITPVLVTRTSAASLAKLSRSTLTSASTPASTIEGINSEVAKGQWEFQIFGKGSSSAADQVWMARYLMSRLCEQYGVDVNWHCKPLGKEVDWNGSGMHANFSTDLHARSRRPGILRKLMAAFDKYKNEHIASN